MPISATTPYINSIPLDREERSAGNPRTGTPHPRACALECDAIILNANKESSELGGHIASFASAATVRRPALTIFSTAHRQARRRPDLFPGPFLARRLCTRLLEGRISENSAQVPPGSGRRRLSSYTHPWLMPILAVPTCDGPGSVDGDLSGAAHALPAAPRSGEHRRTPCLGFLGDGETDEPESLGAISIGPGARNWII